MADERPYWHEAVKTQEDYDAIAKPGYTFNDLMGDFRQPAWCGYPDALQGQMGCWSLWHRMVTGPDYCDPCECKLPEEQVREQRRRRDGR